MPTAEEYLELARCALEGDRRGVKRTIEVAAARAAAKGQTTVARELRSSLVSRQTWVTLPDPEDGEPRAHEPLTFSRAGNLIEQTVPSITVDNMVLPAHVRESFDQLVEERRKSELLEERGVYPTSRLLLTGEPGTGKTSLAGALAAELDLPFCVVRFPEVIDSYLGVSLRNLEWLFEDAGQYELVLLLDEFEMVATERGGNDIHEMNRLTATLLTEIEKLHPRTVLVAATNHKAMLDKAVWRRFQMRIELPVPTAEDLARYFAHYERHMGFMFGVPLEEIAKSATVDNYGDAREVCDAIFRRHILAGPSPDDAAITRRVLSTRELVMQSRPEAADGEAD